jgi:hypothetical protein
MTPAASAPGSGQRILPVDATRGSLMLFSCLAHFAWWIHAAYPQMSSALFGIGMVATPSFLMVSGAMVGLLCSTPTRAGRNLTNQLFNRGLFLLTVGHILIALTEAHLNGGLGKTIAGVTVVDEIGLCTLIAAFLVPHLASLAVCRRIAMFAVATLLLAWAANLLWMPSAPLGLALKNLLIGGTVDSAHIGPYTAPTLQYMALYAIGLPLGHLFGAFSAGRIRGMRLARRSALIGGLLVGGSCLIRLLRYEIDHLTFFQSVPHAGLDLTLKVTTKIPPSPLYVTFYCGMGLLLLGAAFWLAQHGQVLGKALLGRLAVIGRASLFVFVLQYFLFWTLPDLLGVTPNELCFMVFLGNVLLMYWAATLWGRIRGNRYLTFGIRLKGHPA